MAAAALSLAAQFVVVMTLILPRLAEMYSARDLAEHFNRVGRVPARLLLAEERIGSLVFYLDPRLRAGLTEDQVQYLLADPPTPLRPGDVVAVKERNLRRPPSGSISGDNRYEPVGRYRLYRIAKPQAAGGGLRRAVTLPRQRDSQRSNHDRQPADVQKERRRQTAGGRADSTSLGKCAPETIRWQPTSTASTVNSNRPCG